MPPEVCRTLLCWLTLAGCALPRQVVSHAPEAAATVVDLKVPSFERRHTQLEIELAIENPGDAIALSGADVEVLLEGRLFGEAHVALSSTAARGRSELTLSFEMAHQDLPRRVEARALGGEAILLVARGALHGTSNEGPVALEFSSEAPVRLTSAEGQDP